MQLETQLKNRQHHLEELIAAEEYKEAAKERDSLDMLRLRLRTIAVSQSQARKSRILYEPGDALSSCCLHASLVESPAIISNAPDLTQGRRAGVLGDKCECSTRMTCPGSPLCSVHIVIGRSCADVPALACFGGTFAPSQTGVSRLMAHANMRSGLMPSCLSRLSVLLQHVRKPKRVHLSK